MAYDYVNKQFTIDSNNQIQLLTESKVEQKAPEEPKEVEYVSFFSLSNEIERLNLLLLPLFLKTRITSQSVLQYNIAVLCECVEIDRGPKQPFVV